MAETKNQTEPIPDLFVDYQLQVSDYQALANYRWKTRPQPSAKFYYYGIIPILCVGLAIAAQSFTIAVIFTGLYLFTGWWVSNYSQRLALTSHYSEENFSFHVRPRRVEIKESGLIDSSDLVQIFIKWSGIQRIYRDSNHVYFDLSPLYSLIIPLRAFKNEQHVESFLKAVQDYLKH